MGDVTRVQELLDLQSARGRKGWPSGLRKHVEEVERMLGVSLGSLEVAPYVEQWVEKGEPS